MIALFVALGAAAAAVLASSTRARHVRRATAVDVGRLAGSIGRRPSAERLARLADDLRVAGAADEAELVADLVAAPGPAARVALGNEHLGDLDARLRWGEAIPPAAARLAMLGTVLALAIQVLRSSALGPEALGILAAGGAGWAISGALGRSAARRADEARRGLDALVERALAGLSSEEPPQPPAGVDPPGPAV